MNSNTKAILFSLLIFLAIFLITTFLLRGIFDLVDGPISGIISAITAAVLSPRRTIIKKQTGNDVLLTWFFSKKVIHIK